MGTASRMPHKETGGRYSTQCACTSLARDSINRNASEHVDSNRFWIAIIDSGRSIRHVPRPAAPQVEDPVGSEGRRLPEGSRSMSGTLPSGSTQHPRLRSVHRVNHLRRFSGNSNQNWTERVEDNRLSRGVIDFGRCNRRIAVVAAMSGPTPQAHTRRPVCRVPDSPRAGWTSLDASARIGWLESVACSTKQYSVPVTAALTEPVSLSHACLSIHIDQCHDIESEARSASF